VALTTPPGERTAGARSQPAAGEPSPAPEPLTTPFPAGAELPPLVLRPHRRRSLVTRRQKIVAGVLIGGSLCFLLFRGLTNALDYYLTTNQAVAQKAQLGDSDFRIQGTVLPGIRQVGTTLRFTITSHKVAVGVLSTGSPPQLFKVGMPVVLEGHWQGDIFSSYQIMVQHSANYVEAPAKPKAKPSTAAAA